MDDLLGLIVPRPLLRRRRLRRPALRDPDLADLERLQELRMRGSRLDLKQPVRAYLDFAEEAGARAAGEALTKDGYRCALRTAGEGSWVVTAISDLVPTERVITTLREDLEKMAEELGGTYGGWDAPIVA
ncbi:MAG: ribonuclease E inhibitor RraB [Candidatus Dormibacteraeota bacterium]|nr:ribonuclease E inhibitor RraB [Candidatus Dormibacteraeota bacterium]MBO0706350.1 ribonuclease E inhibitor RraB [Candidatus Dormibacteraeota bacterium]MBO0760603.1 ribonuclease E inhibitor RraB [Candidatus Dormibacteraeota bacterium]